MAHGGRQVKQGGFDDGVEGPVQDKLLGGRPGGGEVAGAGQGGIVEQFGTTTAVPVDLGMAPSWPAVPSVTVACNVPTARPSSRRRATQLSPRHPVQRTSAGTPRTAGDMPPGGVAWVPQDWVRRRLKQRRRSAFGPTRG